MVIRKILLIFLVIIFLSLTVKIDFSLAQQDKIEINFFYSAVCSHCAKEKEFLKELKNKYPEIEVREYEVIYNSENQEILREFYEKYQVPQKDLGWIPATFTSTKYFIGFNEQIGKEIESCIKECLIGEGKPVPQKIKFPFLGEIDIYNLSLPVLTITLAALDGFNPCAMWILLFLISLLINTRSRKRMLLIGGTFILASGVVYFLILNAWLNLFLAMSYVNLTRILIGVVALGIGTWQIKSFITYKGTCPVVDGNSSLQNKLKNGLKSRAEKIALSPLTLGMLGGVILLAFGVNLVEFFCSAGLPAIYTRILSLSEISTFSYYLYLLLYTLVFLLDDLIIFSVAVITLTRLGFTDKYNYWATLIGGLLMFTLGILLIFKPELLMFT